VAALATVRTRVFGVPVLLLFQNIRDAGGKCCEVKVVRSFLTVVSPAEIVVIRNLSGQLRRHPRQFGCVLRHPYCQAVLLAVGCMVGGFRLA